MGPIAWFTQVPLLASMPRLSAALIQSGQSAAAGAAGAAGVVAVATVPAAATTHVHQGTHHQRPPAVEQTTSGVSDPLAAVLALTGHRSLSTTSPSTAGHHGKSGAHSKRAGHASDSGLAHGKGPDGQSGHGNGTAKANTSHGKHKGTTKRHHGKTHKATSPTPVVALSTTGRCAGNNGSGVGNGGGTTTNTHAQSTTNPTPPAGLRYCS